jgi:uncharacterized protein (TIGR02270 family)
MAVILEIVHQHAEEAAVLWLLRDRAVNAPHYSLADLSKLDRRVEAHLDALRIAGTAGWEACESALAHEEAGEVFAAAILALGGSDDARVRTVIDMGTSNRATARGLISALSWTPYGQVKRHLARLLDADAPAARRVGIAASAAHRRALGPVLAESMTDPDPSLRAQAFRAAGELGTVELLRTLAAGLADEDAECRFWAAWSCALLGDRKGIGRLQHAAERGGRRHEEAARMALRCMEPGAAKLWLRQLAGSHKRLAVIGAGVVGDPAAIPWLIEQFEVPELARIAGEALTAIAGVDLALENLEGKRPQHLQTGPTENPEDEDVTPDPDEALPWPDARLVETWWRAHRGEFRAGARYLLGKPMTSESLAHVLREGRQRQRAAAATELSLSKPGRRLFNVRAPGFQQKQALQAADQV